MSIKFVCTCGKHLRARDEMAMRRAVCPRCGQPVGIPGRDPVQPGSALHPLSPDERRRTRPPARDPAVAPTGAEVAAEQLLQVLVGGADPAALLSREKRAARKTTARARRRQARAWQLEQRWDECLVYPCRAYQLVL